jgi:hypothetical protein
MTPSYPNLNYSTKLSLGPVSTKQKEQENSSSACIKKGAIFLLTKMKIVATQDAGAEE